MATQKSATLAGSGAIRPAIRNIDRHDLIEVLQKGRDDFLAYPSHLVLLAVIYPIVGVFLARLAFGYDILPLLFPIISGFALIGPLAAVGLYEMSKQRESGGKVGWKVAFEPFKSASIFSIFALAILQLIIYFVWLGAALIIYDLTFGEILYESIPEFFDLILTTNAGWSLIIIGCSVGFLFAAAVLTISAVSFPMLVDRDVGPLEAVNTSVRAIMANPMTMMAWGFIVAVLLALGTIPIFVGLAVIMPILGHATWHLYRKVVKF